MRKGTFTGFLNFLSPLQIFSVKPTEHQKNLKTSRGPSSSLDPFLQAKKDPKNLV